MGTGIQGFQALAYEPLDSHKAKVFAVTGTQFSRTDDRKNALSRGLPHWKDMQTMKYAVDPSIEWDFYNSRYPLGTLLSMRTSNKDKRIFESIAKELSSGKSWILTGHSAGGALVQVMGYKLAENLPESIVKNHLSVVTWNALGGAHLLKQMGVKENRQLTKSIPITNYVVEGDLVPKIEEHVGPVVYLKIPNGSGFGSGNEVAKKHRFDAIFEAWKNHFSATAQ